MTKTNIEEAKQELYREYVNKVAETIRDMDTCDIIELLADVAGVDVYTDIEEAFDGNVYDAIKFGQEDPYFDVDADYFTNEGWGGLKAYDSLEDIKDFDDLAEQIIDDDDDGGNYEIEELLDAYKEALEALAEETDDTEAKEQAQRERLAERSRTINSLVNVALSKALEHARGADSVAPNDVHEEMERVRLALVELFDVVQERAFKDEDDATREEITSQFIKEEV